MPTSFDVSAQFEIDEVGVATGLVSRYPLTRNDDFCTLRVLKRPRIHTTLIRTDMLFTEALRWSCASNSSDFWLPQRAGTSPCRQQSSTYS